MAAGPGGHEQHDRAHDDVADRVGEADGLGQAVVGTRLNTWFRTTTQLISSGEAAISRPSRTWRNRPAALWAAKGRLSRAAAASGTAAR
jgi:hypothetical protein